MKKTCYILILSCLGLFARETIAQTESSKAFRKELIRWATDYQNENGKVMRLEIGEIHDGETISIFRQLTAEQHYEIRALTDDFSDVVMYVYQDDHGDWDLEGQDLGNAKGARVRVQPSRHNTFNIRLRGYGFDESNKGKYALIISVID